MFSTASTFRSKMAVCAASVALMAGLLAAPAGAETEHKRWLPIYGQAAHPGNVEQGAREVNLRYDGYDHGKPPAWLLQQHGKGKGKGHQQRFYPQHPPGLARGYGGEPRYAQPRHVSRDRRYGSENHYHYYYYGRPQVQTRVVYYPVPYHIPRHDSRYVYQGAGVADAMCSGGYADGGRYVMGGSHTPGGTILGGIVGAAIGSQIGGGKGRLAAVGVGTLIGALIGRDIGYSMDAADRAYATGSFGHAMEYAPTCSSIAWNNPQTGSAGTVTPVVTYEPEPGRYCREFQQQVVIGGQVQDAYGTACRQPDGSWEIVAEKP